MVGEQKDRKSKSQIIVQNTTQLNVDALWRKSKASSRSLSPVLRISSSENLAIEANLFKWSVMWLGTSNIRDSSWRIIILFKISSWNSNGFHTFKVEQFCESFIKRFWKELRKRYKLKQEDLPWLLKKLNKYNKHYFYFKSYFEVYKIFSP